MIGNDFFGAGCATSSFLYWRGGATRNARPGNTHLSPGNLAFSFRRGMALEAAMTSEQRPALQYH